MPRPDLSGFESELLKAGLSPRHVRRTIVELDDHYADLVENAVAGGVEPVQAEEIARQQLGNPQDLAAAMRAYPELRCWAHRYPLLAVVVYPLTCLAVLPAVPVLAGIAHASQLGRWAASILLSGLFTAAMFLALQLAIVLN